MGNFKSVFEAYGGDYDVTMSRFMGKETLYMKILGMMFQDENLKKLGTAIEENDLDAAFEAAHTLKGVAGNLGLTPFYDSVCRIVSQSATGKSGRITPGCIRRFRMNSPGLMGYGKNCRRLETDLW